MVRISMMPVYAAEICSPIVFACSLVTVLTNDAKVTWTKRLLRRVCERIPAAKKEVGRDGGSILVAASHPRNKAQAFLRTRSGGGIF